MTVEFEIFATKAGAMFSPNTLIGKGTLEGNSPEDIKKQAENLVENPEGGLKFLNQDINKYGRKMYDYQKNSFRIEFEVEGKKYNIKPKNNKSKNNKDMKKSNFNDYFEDVMGTDPKEPQNNEQEVTTTTQETKKKVGRPKKDKSQESENETEPRTYKLRNEILQKVKLISIKTGRSQTEVVEFALMKMIDSFEEKNGTLDVEETPKSLEEFF